VWRCRVGIAKIENRKRVRRKIQTDKEKNMKTLELPYIRFGRNKDGVTDFYNIREWSPSIPEKIVVFFRDRFAKSIQWESSEETTDYADCFLIWRMNHSGFLFAKLSDGGCDSLKRNHSIQIDAVYLTNEQLPDTANNKASFFASLCFYSVWEHWEKHRRLQPVDETEQKVTELAEKLLEFFSETTSPIHSLFLASHQYFTPCGIDRIVYNIHNNKYLLNRQPMSVETKPVNLSVLPSKEPLLYLSLWTPRIFFALIILLTLGVLATSWTALYWYGEARTWQTDCDSLRKEHEDTIDRLTSKSERERKTLQDELISIKNIAEEQLQQIHKKNSEIEKLENDKKNLNDQLKTARRNADESLKNDNESLKKQNEQLNKKINIIREHIEIIYNELSSEK
jgi:hypothetical protein